MFIFYLWLPHIYNVTNANTAPDTKGTALNNTNELILLQEFLNAAAGLMSRDGRGYFFDSCITHVQAHTRTWNTIKVNNQTAAETFANWYFGRTTGSDHEVDCAYPCNKSC